MAIILCPECNKQISDRSKVCIHCGFPLDEMNNTGEQNNFLNDVQMPVMGTPGGQFSCQDSTYNAPLNNQVGGAVISEGITANNTNNQYPCIGYNQNVSDEPLSDQPEMYGQSNSMMGMSLPAVKKKKVLPAVIISAVVVLLIGIAVLAVMLFMPKPLTVENVKVGEWKKNYDKEYGMIITSEQKNPFVALIEMSDDDDTYEEYVYMENGEGEITRLRSKTSDNDELPTETARAIGFYEGTAVGDGYLKSIHTSYKTGNYLDEMGWTALKRYSNSSDLYKMAVFTVETYSAQTGLLIYDVSTNLNKSVDKNKVMPIIKGKGLGDTAYILEEEDKDKTFDVKFIPRFFISAEEISSDQYEVLTKLNLDGEENPEDKNGFKTKEWKGTEKLSLKNNTSGLLLYKVTRTNGDPVVRSWMFENDYKEWYGAEQAKNKVVNIHVRQSFSVLADKPEYIIDIIGYLNYKDFGSGKAVLKENENGMDGIFGNLENEAQKQKELEESSEREEEERNYFKNIKSRIGADDYYVKVSSDGSYMEIDTNPLDTDSYSSYTAWSYVESANEEMGFSESLTKAMQRTRALDGTQTEENDKIKVRWTYHPDHGLEVIYSKK